MIAHDDDDVRKKKGKKEMLKGMIAKLQNEMITTANDCKKHDCKRMVANKC